MTALSQPHEIKEWKDGEAADFTIVKFERGDLEIHPRDGRPAKTVSVIRIHLPPEEKKDYPFYWDLTSARLTGQLDGLLPAVQVSPIRIRITAMGVPPTTHFTVSRLPEKAG